MRSDEIVAARIAELAGGGGGELGAFVGVEVPNQAGSGIEERPAVAAAATIAVGGRLVDVRDRVGAGEHRERTAAGKTAVAGDFPPAKYPVHRAAGVTQEALALAERQFGDEVPLEDVAAVEIARRVVEAAIVDIVNGV